MASTDPAGHLAHPHTAAEQLDVIFTGNGPADYLLIAVLARQLLAEYHRIAGEPGIEWGVRLRQGNHVHDLPYKVEGHARANLTIRGDETRTLIHRHIVVRRDEVGPWIDGEPKAGAA